MIKPNITTYELAQSILLLKLKNNKATYWKYLAVKEDMLEGNTESHIVDDFVKSVIEMAEKIESGISPNAFMTPAMKKTAGLVETISTTVETPAETSNPS